MHQRGKKPKLETIFDHDHLSFEVCSAKDLWFKVQGWQMPPRALPTSSSLATAPMHITQLFRFEPKP